MDQSVDVVQVSQAINNTSWFQAINCKHVSVGNTSWFQAISCKHFSGGREILFHFRQEADAKNNIL